MHVVITIIAFDENDDIANHMAHNFLEYLFSSLINLADTRVLPAPWENICEYDSTFKDHSYITGFTKENVCQIVIVLDDHGFAVLLFFKVILSTC